MNTQIFLDKYFETAFSAPDGIKRLRELILTLAMQGKLVPQDPNDQPARELLQEIEAEKERLIRSGKIKRQKPLPEIKPGEIPYDLPESWEWVRFNQVLDVRDGTHDTPKYTQTGFPLITSKNLYSGILSFENIKYISKDDHFKIIERSKVNNGDILFAMIGSIGNPVIVDCDIEFSIKNVALFKFYLGVKPYNKFLYFYLIKAQENMRSISSGAVQSFVSLSFLRNYLFPLPPLAEQKRIVEKIDRLMAQCDKLEQLQKEKEQKRILIHTAAREKLLKASDQKTFGQTWNFIKENFGELYAVKENITSLRQAILQLAVMGKLVPQDPNDPPARELLKEIEAEKQRLIKEGKIKPQKTLSEITVEEIPYDIPDTWEWCRWSEVALQIGDIDHKMPKEMNEGIPYVSPRDFYGENEINFHSSKKISIDDYEKLSVKIRPEKYDIIFPRYGTLGVNRFVLTNIKFLASYSCAIVKSLTQFINPKYSYYYSISSLVQSEIERYTKKTTQANVGVQSIKIFLYPLPPLSEQHRIVAKVDALMALCDQLEQQIEQQTVKQTQLLNAVMAEI